MAQERGKKIFIKNTLNVRKTSINVFDGATRFFRGKAYGWQLGITFLIPLCSGTCLYRGYNFTISPLVPHDVNGMIQTFGGKEEFVAAFDDIFNTDAEIHGNLVDISRFNRAVCPRE